MKAFSEIKLGWPWVKREKHQAELEEEKTQRKKLEFKIFHEQEKVRRLEETIQKLEERESRYLKPLVNARLFWHSPERDRGAYRVCAEIRVDPLLFYTVRDPGFASREIVETLMAHLEREFSTINFTRLPSIEELMRREQR
jgi:hypothetical protein